MPLILSGTTGVSGVDGTTGTPAIKGVDTDTGIVYGTNTVRIATNGTTAVTVDASQNVGIGTDSPATNLVVKRSTDAAAIALVSGASYGLRMGTNVATGAVIEGVDPTGNASYQPLTMGGSLVAFSTSGTDRARIDASGNLLVGTSIPNARIYGMSGANFPTGRFDATLTSGYTSEAFQVVCGQPSGTGFKVAAFYINNAAAYAAFIRGDGTIFAQSTTIQSASDARLKENIRDAVEGLDTILALKPRRFDWKQGEGSGKKDQIGFIAQEVETVFPDAVDRWEKPNDDTEYKSVGSSLLIPVLVKAIQELSAKLDAAEARIAALEAK